jgi:hypothetical protein
VIENEVKRLIVRRQRQSPEVASVVGADWAERKPPQNWLVPASEAENDVASELDSVWLHPPTGVTPYSTSGSSLFPWTLAKAFLSSPAALLETIRERIRRLGSQPSPAKQQEIDALRRLEKLAATANDKTSAKYARLENYLRGIDVGPQSPMRAVVFAERVATLKWLQLHLQKDLRLREDQVVVLHGGLTDQEQQGIVESFKQASSPIRVLVTGDLASEGVNLHTQCHELIHFDIPWSLIRIEQRNGRIDRYGQRQPPQITTLLLTPDTETFSGDLRVLSRLIEKEHEAHTALGDAASLMGKYDVEAEEAEIKRVLAGQAKLDDVVKGPGHVTAENSVAGLLARIMATAGSPAPSAATARPAEHSTPLYPHQVDFLREALQEAYLTPEASVRAGGLDWREYPAQSIVEFVPPPDLRQRLEMLPQSYLADRRVMEKLKLVTSLNRGRELLADALADETGSSWPEAHFLGPLHPVLDWAADRALATLGRNQVFVVRGAVDVPTVLLVGTLTNLRGQVVASAHLAAGFPNPANPGFCMITPYASAAEMTSGLGLDATASNPGSVPGVAGLQPLIGQAVQAARSEMTALFAAAEDAVGHRVDEWSQRTAEWTREADVLVQRSELQRRRVSVKDEQAIVERMSPDRQLVRPLLIVVPRDYPAAGSEGE